jgi:hypothetical protein
MLQTTIKRRFTAYSVVLVFIGVLLVHSTSAISKADDNTRNMAELLTSLSAQDVTLYLEFVHPVAGQAAWFVPDKITVDGQDAGQRQLKEIGTDYVCITENGIGLRNDYCIPFSNLAFVNFYPPAN